MSGNSEPERSGSGTPSSTPASGAGKLYPMDLALVPQKITIVKGAATPVGAADGKLHLATPQGKTHLLSHAGPISLVRPTPQIISQGVASQPQMIVSGTSLMPAGSQHINQTSQIISQSQMVSPTGQLIMPQTQLISQGTQLMSQGPQVITQGSHLMSGGAPTSSSQVLSVGSSLVGGASVVVSSSAALRSLPSSMRVLPPTSHHNVRPVVSSVTVTALPMGAGAGKPGAPLSLSSHVPRGPAAGASLAVPRAAVRPLASQSPLGGWGARGSLRGPALVYSARAATRGVVPTSPAPAPAPTPASHSVHSQTPPSTTLAGSGLMSPATRMSLPRAALPRPPAPHTAPHPAPPRAPSPHPAAPRAAAALAPAPRPLPVLQRNYQPAKVVAVGNRSAVPVSGTVQRSALYYEVTRSAAPPPALPPASSGSPFTYTHSTLQHSLPAVTMSVVPVTTAVEARLAPETSPAPAPAAAAPAAAAASHPALSTPLVAAVLARPSILRKRDVDGSPSKSVITSGLVAVGGEEGPAAGWGARAVADEEAGGGSTTESAASSPAPDDEPPSPPRAATPPAAAPPADISPRKKPRKQILSSEVRTCEFNSEEPPPPPPSPPAVVQAPPPRRPLLGAGWVCGWRATALHFTRPSDVRRREPRPHNVLELASQKQVLTKANGWKVHHLTAQMDDLVELESASCEQLAAVLRSLDAADSPQLHSIMELVKGNMQRSRIVCEGMEEARADILRVFTHRSPVADILARQADKRCFRKHRSSHS